MNNRQADCLEAVQVYSTMPFQARAASATSRTNLNIPGPPCSASCSSGRRHAGVFGERLLSTGSRSWSRAGSADGARWFKMRVGGCEMRDGRHGGREMMGE